MMAWIFWLEFWACLLRDSAPRGRSAEVISMADWRVDHPPPRAGRWA